MHAAWAYVLANAHNKVFYVEVTTDLRTRVWEHKTKQHKNSITSKYNIYKLVYFEGFELIIDEIARETYIKNQTRIWKLELVKRTNPQMAELSADF